MKATRIKPAFLDPIPSIAKKASVTFDFTKEDADRITFGGTFDRTQPPDVGGGVTAVLRVGAYRADIPLIVKGKAIKSAKGAPAKVLLKAKKKKAIFKVALKKADLQVALAALPDAETLPRMVRWSLRLPDGWSIAGVLPMNAKDKLKTGKDGALTRAILKMLRVK
jgi:hypothetical protein